MVIQAISITIFLIILCFILRTSATQNCEVDTTSGTIIGNTICHDGKPVCTYLGIPFAKPPLGELRFKRPEPVERSNTPIYATRMSSACMQSRKKEPKVSEDCLYLNIWVPMCDGSSGKKSVMFWIHGGGFRIGSTRMDDYNGLALAADGDVIVVTTNYRLGAFGFLTSDSDDAPGNVGLYDMVEALKWTSQNIGAFGGDPEKITLFGLSSGSYAVGLFCTSPLTRGLFKRIIMQSGAPTSFLVDDRSSIVVFSQKFAKSVCCATDEMTIQSHPREVIDCLRGKNATELADALVSLNIHYPWAFFPTTGDGLLPKRYEQAMADGDFSNVDVLIGVTRDDGSFALPLFYPEIFGELGHKDFQINKTYGESLIRGILGRFTAKDSISQFYLGNLDENDYDKICYQIYTSYGDFVILCPSSYFADRYAKFENNVYFYFFAHRPSNSPRAPWMGAAHDGEVQFAFGSPLRNPENYTLPEVMLSRNMVRIWSNFAKTGKPNSRFEAPWPQYSRSNPEFVYLNTIARRMTGFGPHRENCEFYRSLFGLE